MTDPTPLDAAHERMEKAPENDAARLQFYDALIASELFLLLTREAEGDTLDPDVFDLGDARFVLAFDTEDRLSSFAERTVPYAALPGRALVSLLAGQDVGLALNLEVAPSSILLPPEAIAWLDGTLTHQATEAKAKLAEVKAPDALPEGLITALDGRLARAQGLARKAYLAKVTYNDGTQGHLIGLTGVREGAEAALVQAINDALVFSGIEAGWLDVLILNDQDQITAKLAKVALRFDLPDPPDAELVRPAPGSDPDKPPKLR